jgi:hypothetical protein
MSWKQYRRFNQGAIGVQAFAAGSIAASRGVSPLWLLLPLTLALVCIYTAWVKPGMLMRLRYTRGREEGAIRLVVAGEVVETQPLVFGLDWLSPNWSQVVTPSMSVNPDELPRDASIEIDAFRHCETRHVQEGLVVVDDGD